MTPIPTGQCAQAQRASVEATYRIAADMFIGFEKLVQLNIRMAKTSLEANQARWLSALSGKGLLAFFKTPTGAQPFGEQVAAYNRQIFDILTGVQKSLAERMGAQCERQAREVQSDVDEKSRSGPFGSEAGNRSVEVNDQRDELLVQRSIQDRVSGRRNDGVGHGGRHGRDPSSTCDVH
jgi:phasin family protein